MKLSFLLMAILLAGQEYCLGQSIVAHSSKAQWLPPTTQSFRTIITYNGQVGLSTPTYEVLQDGRVVFKQGGSRFDGAGYFWSPAVHDNVVRRNHYNSRIVGQPSQFWPPISQVSTQPNRIEFKRTKNPYFTARTQVIRGSRRATSTRKVNQNFTQQQTPT